MRRVEASAGLRAAMDAGSAPPVSPRRDPLSNRALRIEDQDARQAQNEILPHEARRRPASGRGLVRDQALDDGQRAGNRQRITVWSDDADFLALSFAVLRLAPYPSPARLARRSVRPFDGSLDPLDEPALNARRSQDEAKRIRQSRDRHKRRGDWREDGDVRNARRVK